MKKRSSKPRQPKPPSEVAEQCAEYRATCSEYICETHDFMRKDPVLREKIDAMVRESFLYKKIEVHHVYGRGKKAEHNWFCNLVQSCAACHRGVGHDFSPHILELASLAAKWERHDRHRDLQIVGIEQPNTPPDRLHWNLGAYAAICDSPSLAGRLAGILIPSFTGTIWEELAIGLLTRCD